MRRSWMIPALVVALAGVTLAWAAEGHAGRWRMVLPMGEPAIEVVMTLEEGDPSRGRVESPSHPELELTLEAEIDGREIRFQIAGLPEEVTFAGSLSEDGSRIAGELTHSPPQVPATDIHLVEVDTHTSPWRVISARNATDRAGYDNQPHFLTGGKGFLYTSMRGGQADIYRYDLRSHGSTRVTSTPGTSEYSPTPLPKGRGFSTVRVEEDGTQRLWAFDLDGGNPRLLLENAQPVGYHAWLDRDTVALFILGTPHTLQIARLDDGGQRVVDEEIGRSLHRAHDGAAVLYVRGAEGEGEVRGGEGEVRRGDAAGEGSERLVAMVAGSEDFTVLRDGRLLTGDGSVLRVHRRGAEGWSIVADLSEQGISGITRLAVHRGGRWLAVVGERADAAPEPSRVSLTLTRDES